MRPIWHRKTRGLLPVGSNNFLPSTNLCLWAKALMNAGADAILYESTRHSPGQGLALFQTKAATESLSAVRRIGSSYDNRNLLAELFAEGVSITGL